MTMELSVIIPTYNESANLPALLKKLEIALEGVAWEVIVVDDDSPDGTHRLVKTMASSDQRIRCIRRVNRRGLAGACIEGILSSSVPFVAVMDADLQHDETILPLMLQRLRSGETDLVVGSRYVDGGAAASGFSQWRAGVSLLARNTAQWALCVDFEDLMSGFFMIRREIVENIAPDLSTAGFKILLDIAATSGPTLRIEEIGYAFRKRTKGESKLDARVAFDFLGLIAHKMSGGLLPTRFVSFALVGLSGVLIHLVALYMTLSITALAFVYAQAIATWIAMTSNFFINNSITYKDVRLQGGAFLYGLLRFYLVCSVGALANVAVAGLIFAQIPNWLVAGLAGVAMGSVWNYALSSIYVWKEGD